MVPVNDDPRWNKLLKGEIRHQFRSVPAGLMFSRLRRSLDMDSSEDNHRKCMEEVITFFRKYEKILADDIAAIFG